MPAILVHIPDRNIRVPMRTLTRAEIMMELDLAPVADAAAAAERMPVVFARDGEAFASSRDVAAFFEKNHRDVTRAVDALINQEPDLALRNFTQGVYTLAETGGQQHRLFEMTRDGFSLLAMGFTGGKALKWKLKYIEAFNIMEAELRNRPVPQTREQIMASALLLADETMKEQAQQIAMLAPKADALDRIAAADGSFSVTEAAKALQVRPKDLFTFLSTNGWTYRKAGSGTWLGYQTRTNAGDLEHRINTVLQADGTERVFEQVKVTARGLTKLAKLMPGRASVVTSDETE
jgi:Rha family phage regulatory protein